jgi:eukaryotic-like serine/threonine-protein kinase
MLDRYQLGHEVGTGARGAVYRARDRETGRVVAIKLVADTAAGKRAVGDARSIESSSGAGRPIPLHPHIPAFYETKRTGLLCYSAMELAGGRDLRPYTRPTTRLPLHTVLSIMLCIGDALHVLHRHGFVHGDVKPANILFDPSTGSVKLIDIANADDHDARDVTPAYMAPEQLRGDIASVATDLYGGAVTLYELATGRLPFAARSRPEMMLRIAHEPHLDVRRYDSMLPAALAQLLDKMLRKEAHLRHRSIAEFKHELRKLRDGLLTWSRPRLQPRSLLAALSQP